MTEDLVAFMDGYLAEFLDKYIDSSSTTVVLMSDHGSHMDPILQMISDESYLTEQQLPALFISLSKELELS